VALDKRYFNAYLLVKRGITPLLFSKTVKDLAMRGYSDLDDRDTDIERYIAFLDTVHEIDEEVLIPKIFSQFEKDYNKKASKQWLKQRYCLSDYWINKLFRICQKRKRIGLNNI